MQNICKIRQNQYSLPGAGSGSRGAGSLDFLQRAVAEARAVKKL